MIISIRAGSGTTNGRSLPNNPLVSPSHLALFLFRLTFAH